MDTVKTSNVSQIFSPDSAFPGRRNNNDAPDAGYLTWAAAGGSSGVALYGLYQLKQQWQTCLQQNSAASAIGCGLEALSQPHVLIPLVIGYGVSGAIVSRILFPERRNNNDAPDVGYLTWAAVYASSVVTMCGLYELKQHWLTCLQQNPAASAIGCGLEALSQPHVLIPLLIGYGVTLAFTNQMSTAQMSTAKK